MIKRISCLYDGNEIQENRSHDLVIHLSPLSDASWDTKGYFAPLFYTTMQQKKNNQWINNKADSNWRMGRYKYRERNFMLCDQNFKTFNLNNHSRPLILLTLQEVKRNFCLKSSLGITAIQSVHCNDSLGQRKKIVCLSFPRA